MSYTCIRNLTLPLFVRDVLNHRPPANLRAFNADGGGVITQDIEDVQVCSIRVTEEYRFK